MIMYLTCKCATLEAKYAQTSQAKLLASKNARLKRKLECERRMKVTTMVQARVIANDSKMISTQLFEMQQDLKASEDELGLLKEEH